MIETSKRDTVKSHEAYYNHGILSWLSKAISGRKNRNKYDITINGNIAANNFTDALGYPMSWYTTLGAFSFNAWDSTVRTGTINTSANLTGLIKVGNKLRFTQSGTVKYAIVTAITSATITCFLPNGSTLDNGVAVTDMYFSNIAQPFGFPLDPDIWSLIFSDTSTVSYPNPASGTYYYSGLSAPIGIGIWELEYALLAQATMATANYLSYQVTLSTGNATETDARFNSTIVEYNSFLALPVAKKNIVNFTAKTQVYLNYKTLNPNCTGIYIVGSPYSTTIIKAKSIYL